MDTTQEQTDGIDVYIATGQDMWEGAWSFCALFRYAPPPSTSMCSPIQTLSKPLPLGFFVTASLCRQD